MNLQRVVHNWTPENACVSTSLSGNDFRSKESERLSANNSLKVNIEKRLLNEESCLLAF